MMLSVGVSGPCKDDWIELVAIYRVVVRARTGWRFASLEWTQ